MDPLNRNKLPSNISNEEKEALKTLIQLQKERQIVVKPCDKGAGIIVLDFQEYLRACMEHLEAVTATGEKYYKPVNESVLEEAKSLQERTTSTVPSGFIMCLMQIILDYSIFEFNDNLVQVWAPSLHPHMQIISWQKILM